MLKNTPFLVEDIAALREGVIALEGAGGKRAELWQLIKKSARNAPSDFGWFTAFVALITKEEQDIENARNIIRAYIEKLAPMSLSTGLQYHFWCFAFPHAKVCMYFQWLCTINAFSPEEEKEISQKLIAYHFTNFFYGMRSKPEPECVDNQTLSLCLSNTLVGYLFSQGEDKSKMAEIMLRDGTRRLPIVIGDMPASGYSGEGSSYMDCVNGPAIPLAVELLERITGEKGILFKDFEPGGGKPVSVLKMVAREFMPGGLLLPWDNYGYQFGVRSALAYGALKTKDRLFFDTLENKCVWTYDIGIGWAYDDLVWTLIWWPCEAPENDDDGTCWFEKATGAALVSTDKNYYALQMWDESAPVIPTRSHVNPNAVIFSAFGVPLSADGSPTPGKEHSFMFGDTWRSVGFLAMNTESRYNYGDGCLGAHSCVIIDNNEGLRAHTEYNQLGACGYSADKTRAYCDVTPIYKENYSDVNAVVRKTSLLADRLHIVEDYVQCGKEHELASRFLLRPGVTEISGGVKLTTQEKVSLQLVQLLDKSEVKIKKIENHPFKPDGGSTAVDFVKSGALVQNLFVAMASTGVSSGHEIDGLTVISDENGDMSYEAALKALSASKSKLSMRLPAYMLSDLPNHKTWWYSTKIEKGSGTKLLRLPVGTWNTRLWLNGKETDLSAFEISKELVAPVIELAGEAQTLEFVMKVDVPVSHYDGGGDGTVGMTGGIWLCDALDEEIIESAEYENEIITVKTNFNTYTAKYSLMTQESLASGKC